MFCKRLRYVIALVCILPQSMLVVTENTSGKIKDTHIAPEIREPTQVDTRPLNIFVSTALGSWSHASPQLSIAEILVARGHKVTFASYNDTVKAWLKNYPKVQPLDMGDNPVNGPSFHEVIRKFMLTEDEVDFTAFIRHMSKIFLENYPQDYRLYRQYILNNNVDVVICDFCSMACVDAAYETGRPFVITVHMAGTFGQDAQPYISSSMHPMPSTYEHASFFDRFYDTFLLPIRMIPTIIETASLQRGMALELGTEAYTSYEERWRHGLVLVNSFFGFETPRPLPPNTYMVGPLLPKEFTPLSDELRQFLDAHERVVYVAFGSAMIVPRQRLSTILYALLAAHRDGLIDAVVWGLMRSGNHEESLLSTITIDGTTHSVADMRSGRHPVVRLLDRAPQRAILQHPSTVLFISHCGISSVYETIFAGVPVLGLPIMGDQAMNARKLTELQVGLWLPRTDVKVDMLNDAFHRLLSPDSSLAKDSRANMARLYRMISIADRNRNHSADLIELAAVPGAIKTHETANWRMPWWKARNYDLYAFALLVLSAIIGGVVYAIRYAIMALRFSRHKEKQA
ncbi:hypothetical protein BDF22DRAFT_656084 [Syncephalis plumigaleata]|nr:hypothetical protein BDF22DRAFT_656084 [Syncephalis plumigaleata]